MACAADHPDRADCAAGGAGGDVGAGTFHLYVILIAMKQKNKPTETMLVLTMACLVLYVVFHVKAGLWLCFGFGGVGIFSGYLSRQIDWVWTRVGQGLGWISNGVLLSVVYLFVVVPVAVIRRMRGKERLTRFDEKADSNFVTRDHVFSGADLERTG